MIEDPLFYLVAVPAVLIAGISKDGFGAGLGLLAVPLMALVLARVQAAAIMLPILCLMDVVGLWAYWNKWGSGGCCCAWRSLRASASRSARSASSSWHPGRSAC